jgi:hypothetical protein
MIPGSRRTIENSGGSIGGLGLLTAAKIIAWINIALGVLGLVVFVIAIAVSSSNSSNAVAHFVGALVG